LRCAGTTCSKRSGVIILACVLVLMGPYLPRPDRASRSTPFAPPPSPLPDLV
jgi:hypothetical protein